jgi:3-hydroxyisobutyrate dehydrogenase
MRVGVIGLGAMGMGGRDVLPPGGPRRHGLRHDEAARDAFARAGGQAVARADAMPEGTEAVLTLVVNAAQTRDALFGPRAARRASRAARSSSPAPPCRPGMRGRWPRRPHRAVFCISTRRSRAARPRRRRAR